MKNIFFPILMLFTAFRSLTKYFKLEGVIVKLFYNNPTVVNVVTRVSSIISNNILWFMILVSIYFAWSKSKKMSSYNFTWEFIKETFQRYTVIKINLLGVAVIVLGPSVLCLVLQIIMACWVTIDILFWLESKGFIQID